jgi:glycosyltransferase involved in cell wall biosynthesis
VTASSGPEAGVDVVRITTRLNVGGIARHVSWLTSGLAAHGYQSLLVSGVVPPGEDDMSYFARGLGVEPHLMPQMSREISFGDLITVWKLYRLFVRLRPRVVHTHAAKAGTVGRLAGLMYRWLTPAALVGRPRPCRFVHTYHGHVFHSYYGRLKTWVFLTIERVLARLATDRIVVISRQQLNEIHGTYRVGSAAQFRIIPLGLDLSAFSDWRTRRAALRAELGVPDETLLLGIVGRLTEIKNHRLFLDVAAAWQRGTGGPPVRFVVIGDGHLRGDLESRAKELGLEKDVTFLGNREDPETFYPGLDVVALTSRNEGTPLTLIEGMANARPVIATDVGGVIDLVGEEAGPAGPGYGVRERGVLVRPDDAEAFTRALAHLVGDARLRGELGRRGHEFVQRCYAKERLLEDVAELYDGLTGKDVRAGLATRTGGDACVS